MLSNDIKRFYRFEKAGDFKVFYGAKGNPTLGTTPNKVANSTLDDKIVVNEFGRLDLGDLEMKCKKYLSTEPESATYKDFVQNKGKLVEMKFLLPDGTYFTLEATTSVSVDLGSDDETPVEWTLGLAPQSEPVEHEKETV